MYCDTSSAPRHNCQGRSLADEFFNSSPCCLDPGFSRPLQQAQTGNQVKLKDVLICFLATQAPWPFFVLYNVGFWLPLIFLLRIESLCIFARRRCNVFQTEKFVSKHSQMWLCPSAIAASLEISWWNVSTGSVKPMWQQANLWVGQRISSPFLQRLFLEIWIAGIL